MVHHSTVRYRGAADETGGKRGVSRGVAWRGVLLNVHRKGDDDEVKLNLTTRGTTQCNMRGGCARSKGDSSSSYPNLSSRLKSFPSSNSHGKRCRVLWLPRSLCPPSSSTPEFHYNSKELFGAALNLKQRVVSTKERHTGRQKAATKQHVMDIRGHVIFSQHANSS